VTPGNSRYSGGVQHPLFEEGKATAAVHAPLQELELGNLSLRLPLAPGQAEPGQDSIQVLPQLDHERLELRETRRCDLPDPLLEPLLGQLVRTVADQPDESLEQSHCLLDVRLEGPQLVDRLALLHAAIIRTQQEQAHRLPWRQASGSRRWPLPPSFLMPHLSGHPRDILVGARIALSLDLPPELPRVVAALRPPPTAAAGTPHREQEH